MQTREEIIKQAYEQAKLSIERYENINKYIFLKGLDEINQMIAGKIPISNELRQQIGFQSYYTTNFLSNVFDTCSISDPIIRSLIHPDINENSVNGFSGNVRRFIRKKLYSSSEKDFPKFIEFLYNQGFDDRYIADCIAGSNYYLTQQKELTNSAIFLLELISKYENNGTENNPISDILHENSYQSHDGLQTLKFLFEYYPKGLKGKYEKYLFRTDTYNNQVRKYFLFDNCRYLLERDTEEFADIVLNGMHETKPDIGIQFSIYLILENKLPGKYDNEIEIIITKYFNEICKAEYHKHFYKYINETYTYNKGKGFPMSVSIATYLLEKNEESAKARIKSYVNYADFYSPEFLKFLSGYFGENSLEYLACSLYKNPKYLQDNYYSTLFNLIEKYNFRPIENQIWDFAENHANKANRELATQTLSTLGDEVFERAQNLLSAKTADSRITGVLVLSKLDTELARKTLETVVGTEKNDDTRDVILETLADQLYNQPLSLSAIKDLILKAQKRGKLNKFSEKWIDETQLPALFWQEDGSKLSQDEVRFLFYRMARSKGLNSDIEARQVINALDKNKSGGFAKKLVQGFSDSGSNTKFKHYLTTAGQIGGNEILPTLNSIFKQNMDEKRYKMAEYAVEALAMVGTNKALRMVEVISRKFVSKRPSVSERATQALEATAQELNITADELADRIIPDFDFDGLFKIFEAGNEEYRAFVNSDFTLCFFDEDNKMRKSAPKDTSSDLKKEFKEIEKEIREVVKSQSGRLEKYLVDERRWAIDQWQDFFLQNPIMFVYAMKLLWGVFDKNGALKNVFYCSNDTGLYNHEDEEIEFSETDFIGILHPIHLNNELLTIWKVKSYELSFQSIFPQLERRCFYVKEEEKSQNYTRIFDGKDIPKGADYAASTIEKYGWIKSTGDGGHLDIIKKYRKLGIQASVHIEGVYAWYQGGNAKATVHDVSFSGKNWQDKIKLEDIPTVFFSEVLADIDKLIQAI